MIEPSGYVLDPLREDSEFTLCRGRRQGTSASILAISLSSEQPSPQALKRLEHEYALASELDAAWSARPLELTYHQRRPVLILEDPGGEPLDRVLERNSGQPLDLARFLQIAIGLATSLGLAHRQGLIHKDIKPANILVNDAGRVWLTGFGIASKLPHEYQAAAPPEIIAGTLAYMAPEQTGRMNRSVSPRSDLYSLGVTLYEMLTGALPFAAGDPLEWIHCHIARQPVAPADRAKVPEPLSSLIMMLLAKNAEERYQTAFGVEADLRTCLASWELNGYIQGFRLGAHDSHDRLLIPEKLYGREREVEALVAAFGRVRAQGAPELVLVSGYSGVGKSSVVNELHKALVATRGLFASGKFDQFKRDIPYATIAQAFQTLVRQILVKSESEVRRWRGVLAEAVGPNGQIIVNLIPEAEFILGKQPPLQDLSPLDAQRRFKIVFRKFLGAFAHPEHPLALFLDDLQWLDAATLELLESLMTDPDVRHLLLVVAYRDNEVGPSHPLRQTLEAIHEANARVSEILLKPLSLDDVGRLIADALHCAADRALPLAQLVHNKTDGNPFFAIQFFAALADEGLLTFDAAMRTWRWDMGHIGAKSYTDNVVDLMVEKLKRLSATTQSALTQLACLGNVVEVSTLALVYQESEGEIHTALWEAALTGLIVRLEGSYKFVHDRVQEAAYALIPPDVREAEHLRIGRLLASRTSRDEIEEDIFDIVNQLDRGAALIDTREEREHVAELNLIAGKRAKSSMAYAAALNYLAAGRKLLVEDRWERCYELAFALEYNTAECELLTGDLGVVEERLTQLSQRARDSLDTASVARLRITLYTTLDRSDLGVEVCLDYQRYRGVDWSPHPTDEDVRQEYERIWRQLEDRSIEELVELPLMDDPETRATLDVLTEVVTPALFTDKNLLSLVICRMVNLSLKHGNSDGSCFAYVWFGMILGPHFGDYQAGFRFGKLGYDLVEKRGLHRYQARAYMSFGNLVMPWTKHVKTGRALVRRAFDAANKTGDLTFAAYCCNNLNTNLLASGDPLSEVQREAESGLKFAKKARFGLVIDIVSAQLGLIRTLRGQTAEFGTFNQELFDEDRFERHLRSDARLALPECWYWIRKLEARVYANDYASALEAAQEAEKLLWTSPSFFEVAEYHFYGGLARAALYDAAPKHESRHLEALASHHQQLEAWAKGCPENFTNRTALLAAEIARIEGRTQDAMSLYEQAIRSAQENGFIHTEALAYEVAAKFYGASGFETFSQTYLRQARNCYYRWGALGKVKQLEGLHSHLRQEASSAPTAGAIGMPAGQLDVETVVKASQALSTEIVLSKLIDTFMRIVVEHAGAERGLLILLRDGKPQIEAEANISRGSVNVNVRQTEVTPFDLPQSALHYVIRTQERLVLDDASAGSVYSEDEYVRQKRTRSVLCLPIVKQKKLIGALYLENNLTPRAFTPDRVAVLDLLASQAAISLENARLYLGLERSEAYLAQGQNLSHTGSFGWSVPSGEIFWSQETYRIFEYDQAFRPTLEWILQRIHPDDRELVQHDLNRAISEKTGFDIAHRLHMPDGRVKHIKAIARILELSTDSLEFVGAVMDVTAEKQAEIKLRESEAYLAEAQRLSRTGSWAWSPVTGENRYWSDECFRLLGFDPAEGMPPFETFVQRIHPDDQPIVAAKLERSVYERGEYEVDYRIFHPNGEVRDIHVVGHPVLGPSGDLIEIVGTGIDVTERRQAEKERERLRQAQADLAHANRVTTMGELTASVAHEVNQPIAASLTNARTCLRWLAGDTPNIEEAREAAKRIVQDQTRAAEIISRIRMLFKKSAPHRELVSINDIIREMNVHLCGEATRQLVSLHAELSPDLPQVSGDRVQLQQVMMNLILNGIDAMADVEGARNLNIRSLPGERGHLLVSVSDTGVGLPKEVAAHIFDAFFTTKPHGTGMGLRISRSIVEAHGGRLWAGENIPRGANFCFTLPTIDAQV